MEHSKEIERCKEYEYLVSEYVLRPALMDMSLNQILDVITAKSYIQIGEGA